MSGSARSPSTGGAPSTAEQPSHDPPDSTVRHGLTEQLRQLKRVEAETRKLIEAREELKRRFEILTSIPGVSNVTAAGLIAHMPELGTLTGPRAASLAGP